MNLPTICPSCGSRLSVKTLQCEQCSTEITGLYQLNALCLLTPEEQTFVINFIKSSGSLKEMASIMNLSYPSVRNYLNDIIKKINSYE